MKISFSPRLATSVRFASALLFVSLLAYGKLAWGQASLDSSINPGANGGVYSMAMESGKILFGGTFSNFGRVARPRMARLNGDGTLDTTFSPVNSGNGIGRIQCMAVQNDGEIAIGGSLMSVAGLAPSGLARLNENGTLDFGFNPAPNDVVYSLDVQPDGKLILGLVYLVTEGEGQLLQDRQTRDK